MKDRITISIDKDLLKKVDAKVEDRFFGTRSHALEFLIKRRMEHEKKV